MDNLDRGIVECYKESGGDTESLLWSEFLKWKTDTSHAIRLSFFDDRAANWDSGQGLCHPLPKSSPFSRWSTVRCYNETSEETLSVIHRPIYLHGTAGTIEEGRESGLESWKPIIFSLME